MIYDLQKASLMKRFSAFLLDFILMIILITGFMCLISAIVGYDDYANQLNALVEGYEKEFGVSFSITSDEYASMTEEEQEIYNGYYSQVRNDKDYIYLSNMLFNLAILEVSLSFFFSYLILEFIVPLIFKNGQTLGKKVFSIALMRVDGVRVTPVVMFTRSILGKYAVETMVPIMLLLMLLLGVGSAFNLIVIGLLAIFEIVLLIATKTNSFIHDILSSTVAVDLQSQMIFDSTEARTEYLQRIHDESVKKAPY